MKILRSLRRAKAPESDRFATALDGIRCEQHRWLTAARTVADVQAVKDTDGVFVADLRAALTEAGWDVHCGDAENWTATSPAGERMRYAWGDIEVLGDESPGTPTALDDDAEIASILAQVTDDTRRQRLNAVG